MHAAILCYSIFTESAIARTELAELRVLQIMRNYAGKKLAKLDKRVLSKKRVLTRHETITLYREKKVKTMVSERGRGREKTLCLILPVLYRYFVRNNAYSLLLEAKAREEPVEEAGVQLGALLTPLKYCRWKVRTVWFQ